MNQKQPFTAVCGDFHVSRVHFSESSGLFTWKYLDPVFYHIGPQEIPGKFKNVPKLAQIPNWWRHTGSSIDFQMTGPIFLDSAINFT